MIELTQQQREAVKAGEAIHVAAPEFGQDLVVLRASLYEQMRALLEDEGEQQAVLTYAMKQAAQVAKENPFIDSDCEPH